MAALPLPRGAGERCRATRGGEGEVHEAFTVILGLDPRIHGKEAQPLPAGFHLDPAGERVFTRRLLAVDPRVKPEDDEE